MALTWHEREQERPREPIDWVGLYVWALLGSSVVAALVIGALVGK